MLGLKLNHVSKRGHREQTIAIWSVVMKILIYMHHYETGMGVSYEVNSLRPEKKNGQHFAHISKCIFLNVICSIF